MKTHLLFIALGLLSLVTACAVENPGDPAEATMKYLTALVEKDKAAMVTWSCKSWEEQAALEADALMSVGASLSDAACKVVGQEGDFQTVQCTGHLELTYGDENRSIDLGLRTYSMGLEDGQWRVCSYK